MRIITLTLFVWLHFAGFSLADAQLDTLVLQFDGEFRNARILVVCNEKRYRLDGDFFLPWPQRNALVGELYVPINDSIVRLSVRYTVFKTDAQGRIRRWQRKVKYCYSIDYDRIAKGRYLWIRSWNRRDVTRVLPYTFYHSAEPVFFD